MRQLNGAYTQTSNRRHARISHLFQGRFKAILIDSDAYLLELSLRSIESGARGHCQEAGQLGLEQLPREHGVWHHYNPFSATSALSKKMQPRIDTQQRRDVQIPIAHRAALA
jgi:hypothetical protein